MSSFFFSYTRDSRRDRFLLLFITVSLSLSLSLFSFLCLLKIKEGAISFHSSLHQSISMASSGSASHHLMAPSCCLLHFLLLLAAAHSAASAAAASSSAVYIVRLKGHEPLAAHPDGLYSHAGTSSHFLRYRMYVCMYVCMYVMYVCVCVCVCNVCMYVMYVCMYPFIDMEQTDSASISKLFCHFIMSATTAF